MKKRVMSVTLLSLLALGNIAFSQTGGETKTAFSLKEAQEYAFKNNTDMLNANLDAEIAKAQKNEVRGIGLPQVSGSVDFKDFVKIPTTLIPASAFGGPEGEFIPVEFGTKYNTTVGFEASQILFSSDYIVALKASKAFLELSSKAAQRTKIETSVSVAKAYYMVLVSKENLKLLNANVARLQKQKDDSKAMNNVGLVEKIDVDRAEVGYNNLIVEKEQAEWRLKYSELALKFQMGLSFDNQISLTDSLDVNSIKMTDMDTTGKLDVNNRIEYSLGKTTVRLNELNFKRDQYSYLPTLAAYGALNASVYSNEFDLSQKWFPTALIGVKLSVPIFSGLQKNYKVEQSKLTLLKSENSNKQLEKSIGLEVANSKEAYEHSLKLFGLQDKNMELANNVYRDSKLKYDQGTGSSLEVTTAETSLREARTNYYSSLYNVLVAKIDYDKSLGLIK